MDSWHHGTVIFHKVVDDAVEQIRGSHTALSNSAGDGEPVGDSVVDADTAGCIYTVVLVLAQYWVGCR